MTGNVRMALRDASWFNRPDTRSPKVYHVVVVLAEAIFGAACNEGLPLDETTEVSLSDTSAGMRCQRRGCRRRWETADSATEGDR